MNGADILIKTAVNAGVEVCFANPGTTELPLVHAMDRIEGVRGILGLFEGVCTGAADGYGRMKGKPAMTLLHLGPGLGNGLANLHNARRAGTPILNIVGEHATWHLPNDPLLAMEIQAISATVSGWHRSIGSPADISRDTAAAFESAMAGQIATLIVPHDYQLLPAGDQRIVSTEVRTSPFDPESVENSARLMKENRRTAMILGGQALSVRGLMTAARIRTETGCDLLCETFPARVERGPGLPELLKIPYLPEMALDTLKSYDLFILAGAREPVAFFGYPGMPGRLLRDSQHTASVRSSSRNIEAALEALAEAVGAPSKPDEAVLAGADRPQVPFGKLNAGMAGEVLAALQPENAVIVEEAVTVGMSYFPRTAGCPRFTYLGLTGGSIGQGPPCATGAAVACPDRPVINFQADGSAMYTIQSLWTQAREHLNVTTLICSNRSYDILKLEMIRAKSDLAGKYAQRMTDLGGIDWVQMGEAHGVPSVSAETADEMAAALRNALNEDGPHLIELRLF